MSHAPFPLEPGEPLRLHIFLDRSVIEIFGNGAGNKPVSYSSRIYPTRPDSLGLQLFAEGGTVEVAWMDVWQMGNIWNGAIP